MMMKIFGAVLIVSGGFLMGKVRAVRLEQRLTALETVENLFRSFDTELRELRRSPEEFFRGKGEVAENILERRPIKGLLQEDLQQLEGVLGKLHAGSFRESIAANEDYLNDLEKTIGKLREETASSAKALPLVTASVGLITAVMLF